MARLKTLKPRLPELGRQVKAHGWAETRRELPDARGYDQKWRRVIRPAILDRDFGLCQNCRRSGKLTAGNIVDHIVSKEVWKRAHDGRLDGCDDPSNLETTCGPCHKAKTGAEAALARREGSPVLGPIR